MSKEKGRKGLILKTLERCRSLGQGRSLATGSLKAKSCPSSPGKLRVAPEGCFTVYVGSGRERFVVRTECVNHPLFKTLLDEAEMEYGYATEGPLELPCDVELFHRVLWEMEQEMVTSSPRCGFARSYTSYQLLSPARPVLTGRIKVPQQLDVI